MAPHPEDARIASPQYSLIVCGESPLARMAWTLPQPAFRPCLQAVEIIANGMDGRILDDPTDAAGLAAMIRRPCEDKEFRDCLGEKAGETARKYTWESRGRERAVIFEEILRRKSGFRMQRQQP
jgi:hypothetical protein